MGRKSFCDGENTLKTVEPSKGNTTDTCDSIDFGKEKVFTLTEVAVSIQGLKCGEAAGEDKIRPEILKTMNGEGVRWLTKVCQVA